MNWSKALRNIARDSSSSTCRCWYSFSCAFSFTRKKKKNNVLLRRHIGNACTQRFFSSPFYSISKYLWQRIINLLPKHIEINKFSINHIYSRWGYVTNVLFYYWSAMYLQNVCDDGKYCVFEWCKLGRRQQQQQHHHQINAFLFSFLFVSLCWMRRCRLHAHARSCLIFGKRMILTRIFDM